MNGEPASGIHHLEHAYTLNPRGTVLRLFYGIGLFGIADFDSVIEVGLEEHRVLAYSVQDYAEGADSVLARLDLDSVFVPRALGEIGLGLNLAGRSEDYVAYVEARFGSAGSLLEQHPINTFWTTGYLGLWPGPTGSKATKNRQRCLSRRCARISKTMMICTASGCITFPKRSTRR